MAPSLLLAAAAVAALVPLGPASADGCVDTGKLSDRAGLCADGNGCASAYADATPRIMDDTYVVWGCADGRDTFVCYAHARTYTCTNERA